MNLRFLADADSVTLELENAKFNLEIAKTEYELAKKAYDELIALAEDEGFSKAKLKKLTEDRIQSLRDSGMLEFAVKTQAKDTKPKKPKIKVVENTVENELDAALNDETVESEMNA